jgi:23S rRNA pseudouridine2605 synthase
VTKTYRVELAGLLDRDAIAQLQTGIHLAEGVARAAEIRIVRQRRHSTLVEMVLREGKNREIRRMAARLGHKVLSLQRIALGPLRLADLPVGAFRELLSEEVKALKDAVRNRGRRSIGRTAHGPRRPARSVQSGTGNRPHPKFRGKQQHGRRVSR